MEFDIEKTLCKKCSGVDKCNKYCELHICKALINFLSNIDMIETSIGDYNSKIKGGKQDLVVSGHHLYGTDNACGIIMTDIKTILDATQKFNNIFDKTPIQIINTCKERLSLSNDEAQNIANIVSKLTKNKLLIIPFKPGQGCSVVEKEGENSNREIEADIKSIIWRTDKETHKLDATIYFAPKKSANEKSITYQMTDYLDKFKLKSMSIPIKGEKRDNSLIQMTRYGIIKPIVIKNKKMQLAIDGTYLYQISIDETITIVGYWNNKNELVIQDGLKGTPLDKIKENMALIRGHKRYIAPYTLFDANVINVK